MLPDFIVKINDRDKNDSNTCFLEMMSANGDKVHFLSFCVFVFQKKILFIAMVCEFKVKSLSHRYLC